MIRDHLASPVGRHFGFPAFFSRGQALVEIGVTLLKIGRVGGLQFGKLIGHPLGHEPAILGIEPVVGIAQRVHVTHRPGDLAGGDLEDLAEVRDVEISFSADLNFRVAALRLQRRQPADFELQADHHQQVRFLEPQQETGFGLDEVRVLVALRYGIDADVVAADLARDGRQVFRGRDHIQLRGRPEGSGGQRKHNKSKCLQSFGHKSPHSEDAARCAPGFVSILHDQKGCAPWAPMEKMNWNTNSLALRPSP